MLIREHKGSLQESLETVETIGNFVIDVKAHIFSKLRPWLPEGKTANDLVLSFSSMLHDNRCNWDTVIVKVEGYGVFGMINQYPLDYNHASCKKE